MKLFDELCIWNLNETAVQDQATKLNISDFLGWFNGRGDDIL